MSKDACAMHTFLPIEIKAKLKTEQDVLQMRQKLMCLSMAEARLKQNVTEIAKCEEMFTTRCKELTEQIDTYRNAQMTPLQETEDTLVSKLQTELADLKTNHAQESKKATGLESLVLQYTKTHDPELLNLFQFSKEDVNVDHAELFGIHWQCRIDESGDISHDYHYRSQSDIVHDIYQSLEHLLHYDDEEKYIEEFKQQVSVRLPELVETDVLNSYIQKARTNYYKEHYTCVKAKQTALSNAIKNLDSTDTKESLIQIGLELFRQQATTHNESMLSKYRTELVKCLEAEFDSKARIAQLRKERDELTEFIDNHDEEEEEKASERRKKTAEQVGKKKPSKKKTSGKQTGYARFVQHVLKTQYKPANYESDSPNKQGRHMTFASEEWKKLSEEEKEKWRKQAIAESGKPTIDPESDQHPRAEAQAAPLKRRKLQIERTESSDTENSVRSEDGKAQT